MGAAVESGNNREIGIFYRKQIFWNSTCPVDEEYVYNLEKTFNSAKSAQLALVVINTTINVLLSVVCSLIALKHFCCGSSFSKLVKATASWSGHLLRLIKIVPMIISFVYIIEALKMSDIDADCSDELTVSSFNEIISDENSELLEAIQVNVRAFLIDLLQLVVFLMLAIADHWYGDDNTNQQFLELRDDKKIDNDV